MGKKRRGDVVKFPVQRTRAAEPAAERKMSDVIKEIALRLLKKPEAIPSRAAIDVAVLLASAAWNEALGDAHLRADHKKVLDQFDWGGKQPRPELISTDGRHLTINNASPR